MQRPGRAARRPAAGWPRSSALGLTPCSSRACMAAATWAGESTLQSMSKPLSVMKKPGNRRVPVAGDGHAQRLQALQRRAHVEDRLDPGAHHGDRRTGERGQIGRLVERDIRLAVHAAEAAGGEHARCRRAAATALVAATVVAPSAPARGGHGQVAYRELGHLVRAGQMGDLVVGEADHQRRRRSCRWWPARRRGRGRSVRSPGPRAGCPAGAGRARRWCSPAPPPAGRRGAPGSRGRRTGWRSQSPLPRYGGRRSAMTLDRPGMRCETCVLKLEHRASSGNAGSRVQAGPDLGRGPGPGPDGGPYATDATERQNREHGRSWSAR